MKTSLALTRASGRAVRRCITALLLTLLGLGSSTVVVAQMDDFNDGDDAGWTRYDPIGSHPQLPDIATFTFPAGGYRIQTAPSPSPATVGPGRAGSIQEDDSYMDFYVAVDVVDWNETVNQAFGIIARVGEVGLGTTDGYAFTYDFGGRDLDITRFTNEDPSGGGVTVAGNDRINLVKGQSYRFVFIGRGSTLIGRVYQLPNSETPVAEITGSDSMFPSGVCGLLVYDNTSTGNGIADATFDNYRALSVEPPRLTLSYDVGQQGMRISWPGEATGFTLEYSAALPANVWTEAPADQIIGPFEEPFPNDPSFKYYDFDITGNKFYRLRQQ